MAKRKILATLVLAVAFSLLMVSCPPNGENPTPNSGKGTVTVQNGIAKLDIKGNYTYGVGKTKQTAKPCAQAQGDSTEYISLSEYGGTSASEGDVLKFFVTYLEDWGYNGFTNATELASFTIDKSKTELALPTPTASSIKVTGNKTSLTVKKTSAEASSKLIYVLSTSPIPPSSSSKSEVLQTVYEGKELTATGISLKNVDKYLYIYRISPNGSVYSDGYAVTIPNN